MSIHTNANPETSKLREQSSLRSSDSTPSKQPEAVELELSLPMLVVIVLAIIGVLYASYTYFFKKDGGIAVKTPPTTLESGLADVTVSLDYLAIEGDPKANYLFIEYSDFECPYCQGFTAGIGDGKPSTFSQIEQRYIATGIMRHGFAPYISVASHKPAATNETIGFNCAAAQGKAFEYHNVVFQKTLGNGLGIDSKGADRQSILAVAKEIGLNESDFASCYDKRDIVQIDRVQEKINKEVKTPWSDKFGDQGFGTPAFAVCKVSVDNPTTCVGKAYVGAWPYADMQKIIDTFLGADAPK